jgi:hypothetical protein
MNRPTLALALGLASLAACGEAPRPTVPPPGGQAGTAGTGPTTPPPSPATAPLALTCSGGAGPVELTMPCLLGMPPLSELDCTIASARDAKLQLVLPLSFPDALDGEPTLGAPTRFKSALVPLAQAPSADSAHILRELSGTVVFTRYSLDEATFDGRFTHVEVLLEALDGSAVTCAGDDRAFSAVPGNFL